MIDVVKAASANAHIASRGTGSAFSSIMRPTRLVLADRKQRGVP
jgi:hypothetical protein